MAVVALLASWKKTNQTPPPPRGILREFYPGYPWKRPPPGWTDKYGRTLERIWDDEDAEERFYIETPMPSDEEQHEEQDDDFDW
jgi:hypothetical protein